MLIIAISDSRTLSFYFCVLRIYTFIIENFQFENLPHVIELDLFPTTLEAEPPKLSCGVKSDQVWVQYKVNCFLEKHI